MGISAFFDESGKFRDHEVVTFGGVLCVERQTVPFAEEWGWILHDLGLDVFTAKKAFNHRIPLSEKVSSLGLDERIETLKPFVRCIRKHLQVITGMALDVAAFKALPSHYFQLLGDDPFFTAFLRVVLRVIELTTDKTKISMIVDDEEQMALPMYKLYRQVKKVNVEAKNRFAAISFADDEFLYGLQAADLVSSLFRREGSKKFFGTAYDYEPLFAALVKPVNPEVEAIRGIEQGFLDRAMLAKLAEDIKEHAPKEVGHG